MDKDAIFNFAKQTINSDIIMYHKTNNHKYIFFDSKKHYVGECDYNDILLYSRKYQKEISHSS